MTNVCDILETWLLRFNDLAEPGISFLLLFCWMIDSGHTQEDEEQKYLAIPATRVM